MAGRRNILYQLGYVVGVGVIKGLRGSFTDESTANSTAEESEDADMTDSSAPVPGALTLG